MRADGQERTGMDFERPGDGDALAVPPAEGRSWEPPSWPSDWSDRRSPVIRRAIGWRGRRAAH